MKWLSKIKLRYIWISIFVSFIAAVLLCWACANADGALRIIVIVLLTICFLYMTVAIQYAGARSFKFKPKTINYPTKTYKITESDLEPKLKKLGYKTRSTDYGTIWTKVRQQTAYKVVIVNDDVKYFNHDNQNESQGEPNKDLANCTKFICYEVFKQITEEYLNRIYDFSIQGSKFYITAVCSKEDGNYVCPNYIKPDEQFKEIHNIILNDLGFEETE